METPGWLLLGADLERGLWPTGPQQEGGRAVQLPEAVSSISQGGEGTQKGTASTHALPVSLVWP